MFLFLLQPRVVIFTICYIMRLKLLLACFIRFVMGENYINLMIKVVQDIVEFHHFGFYMFLYTNETESHLFNDQLTKAAFKSLGYSTVLQVYMEQYEEYVNKFHADLGRIRCLKIINGRSEISRKEFAQVSRAKKNFFLNRVWDLQFLGLAL